jgi:hypothetical protein
MPVTRVLTGRVLGIASKRHGDIFGAEGLRERLRGIDLTIDVQIPVRAVVDNRNLMPLAVADDGLANQFFESRRPRCEL